MNLLREITIKNLLLNKKRSIATIIGILLSTALIFTVFSGVSSFRETLKNSIIKEDGDFHISTKNKELFNKASHHKNFDDYYKVNILGYSVIDDSDDSERYMIIKTLGKDAFDKNHVELVEGRLPKSSDEIVISTNLNKFLEHNLAIGQTLALELGEFSGESFESPLKNLESRSFKIVGYIKRANTSIEKYNEQGFSALSFMNEKEKYIDTEYFYKLKNVRNYSAHLNDIYNSPDDYEIHSRLIRTYGVGFSDETMNVLYGIAAIISAIIVFTSISVIRNSFSISIIEKTKQYGILKSLGATDSQISKDIYFEGFSLGAIGIVLGILLGFIVNKILIFTINKIIKDIVLPVDLVSKVSLLGLLISIILSILTIFLSTNRIVRRVKKFSPLESIRGNKDINIKAKEIKTNPIIEKIFGFAGLISDKNIKRNKKKYRTTIISLITSVSLFIIAFYMVNFFNEIIELDISNVDSNIIINSFSNEKTKDNHEQLKGLASTLLADKEFVLSEGYNLIIDTSNINQKVLDHNQDTESINLKTLDDRAFEKLLKDNKLDKDTKFVTTNKIMYRDDSKTYKKDFLKNFSFEATPIYVEKDDKGEYITKYGAKIPMDVKLIEKAPIGFPEVTQSVVDIFTRDNALDKSTLGNPADYYLAINTDDDITLEKELKKYIQEKNIKNTYVKNVSEQIRSAKSGILVLKIFIYGFICVLTAIGITNIFNTITSNMQSRKIEFAALSSVGLTSKDFKKMNRLESFFLGIKALIYGVPIGILFSYLLYEAMRQRIEASYKLPYMGVIFSVIFVFVVIYLIMSYSSSKMKNINIVETIRNENI